jgi:predicted transcriptional regulator
VFRRQAAKQSLFQSFLTCTPDDDIHYVLKTMRVEKIRRVPVIDHDRGLLGSRSMDDIVCHNIRRPADQDGTL